MRLQSQVVITSKFDDTIRYLQSLVTSNEKIVPIVAEKTNFSVDEVKLAIEKAYLATNEENYILLCADNFSAVVQNRLLKVIEEPPKNKSFMILTPQKSSILPTIYSRLPVHIVDESNDEIELPFSIDKLDIGAVYDFIQSNSRVSSAEARKMVEAISHQAIKSQKFETNETMLQMMHDSILALDKGSPSTFILTGLLLKLLALRKSNTKRVAS